MNEYRIEFSYLSHGDRRYETDTQHASTAQEAVGKLREWYDDLPALRIEQVWIDRNNRWETTGAWD